MNDTRTDGARPPLKAGERGRLDSWKKIAAHFNRDVTTVQRWERREAMPVHRHVHDKLGSVFAFRSELDAWWEGRRTRLAQEAADEGEPAAIGVPAARPSPTRLTRWALAAGVIVVTGALAWFAAGTGYSW